MQIDEAEKPEKTGCFLRQDQRPLCGIYHGKRLSQGMHSSLLSYRNSSGGTKVSSI